MKTRGVKTHLLLLIILSLALASSAEVLLKNTFDGYESLKEWTAYTNDENRENGWMVEDGLLYQGAGNSDDTLFGERFLVKPGVFDLEKLRFPIEICFDIFPYDYVSNSAIWFGAAFFVDPARPDKGEIVAALRKDNAQRINGLYLAIGGKKWLSENHKISTSIIHRWRRVKLRMEKKGDNLTLLGKTWIESDKEPGRWLVKQTISLEENPLAGGAVAIAANAHYGWMTHDPRFFFDNLLIADNGEEACQHSCKTREDGDALRMRKYRELEDIFQSQLYEHFLHFSKRFLGDVPDTSKRKELLFKRVVSYEKSKQFRKASQLMKEIKSSYPDSEIAMKAGGIQDRTEAQALEDYLNLVRDYNAKEFEEAISKMEAFIRNYPENWRTPEVYRRYCFALYHKRDMEKFYQVSEKFIEEDIYPEHNDHVAFLRAAMQVHEGDHKKARAAFENWKRSYPDSKDLRHQFVDLVLETRYKEKDYEGLAREAQQMIDEYPEKSREWTRGMLWFGVSRMNREPVKLQEAAPIFDALLEGDLSKKEVDADQLATAAIWRIWIAQRQKDTKTAQDLVRKVKQQLPEGKARKKVLKRYGNLIEQE